jgi:hypothetical protein
MERYILPVKFTEEERQHYAFWGLKKRKLLLPMVIVFAVLLLISVAAQVLGYIRLYRIDYWLFRHELSGAAGDGTSFIGYFSTAAMLVIFGLIVKVTDVIFDLIHKAPDFVRHLTITMDPEARTAVIEVIRKKIVEKRIQIDICDLPDLLNTETNSITADNAVYPIGNNTVKNIYPGERHAEGLEHPPILPRSIDEVSKMNEIVDGIMAAIQVKQKEMQWEKSKGDT